MLGYILTNVFSFPGDPSDTDAFKTSSGRPRPDVAKTSGKRRLIHVVLKTLNLQRLEDI